MDELNILAVSELTKKIKMRLNILEFKQIAVEGEISNFKHHSSGHMYFTLKDDQSKVKSVMFKSKNKWLRFIPKNGDTVIAIGDIGVYEANGEYQLYVERLLPQGIGILHITYEKLKQRLLEEGLFDEDKKKTLPFLPSKIAIITSQTGAAIRDILSVLKRRYPLLNILIVPAIVQGEAGPDSIVGAFNVFEKINDIDVVILARGGGSIEELWAFNDEKVARSIYNCSIPVVSGIGHETDFTIADFVVDHRAPTPSAAAEIVVPDYFQMKQNLSQLNLRLVHSIFKLLKQKRKDLGQLKASNVFERPDINLMQHRQRVDELISRAGLNIHHRRIILKQSLQSFVGKLDSLSPLDTLKRGYAVCQKKDGSMISSYQDTNIGEKIYVRLANGKLSCVVEKGEPDDV